jgi:hypothetical protein
MMLYPTVEIINENEMKGTYNMYCEVENGRKAAVISFMVTYNCKLNNITTT